MPIGKSMELPPDPTVIRAPHFYPDRHRSLPTAACGIPKVRRYCGGLPLISDVMLRALSQHCIQMKERLSS
jgi:hypothetical protein